MVVYNRNIVDAHRFFSRFLRVGLPAVVLMGHFHEVSMTRNTKGTLWIPWFFTYCNWKFPIFSNFKIAVFLIALLNCQRIIGLHAGSTLAWDVPRYKSVCMNWDTHSKYLVGGLEHCLFSISYMGESFPLTFIFFKMVKTTNQIWICLKIWQTPRSWLMITDPIKLAVISVGL